MGLGYVRVQAFNEKQPLLASRLTCLAWYGLKAAESAMKAVRFESGVATLVGADLFSFSVRAKLARANTPPFQPLEPALWAGGCCERTAARAVAHVKVIFYDALAGGWLHQPHQHDGPQLRGPLQAELRSRRAAGSC